MNPMPGDGPLVLTAIAVATLLIAEKTNRPKLAWKSLASLGFMWAALDGGIPDTVPGWLLLAGLGLSMVGDIALVFERGFLTGLVAFAGAHLLYSGAFLSAGTRWATIIPTALIATVAFVAVRRWLVGKVPPKLRIPVVGYMAIITVMLVTASSSGRLGLYAGAALFYLSDLAVARQRFVAPGFENKLIGLPLYYAGQLLLASAVV